MRNLATPGGAEQARRAEAAARELGLEFLDLPIRAPEELDLGFERAETAGVNGLVVQATQVLR
jgi:hypothetical protein